MNIDQAPKVITMSGDETRVAIAFLGDVETRRLLAEQVRSKYLSRMVLSVELSNHNLDNSDAALRELYPNLYSYELPIQHRVPLLGAFGLCIEDQKPSQSEILVDMEPEQRLQTAVAARDALLAMQ